jgi:two-component system phosphate regulon sensor histidine kinase PhoR
MCAFLAACVLGAGAGMFFGYLFSWSRLPCALGGIVAALALLWLLDIKNASVVLDWLQDEDAAWDARARDDGLGLWAELSRRASRVLRARDRKILREHQQLEQILSALRIAPVGLILLDRHDRVIWGNASASHYLGLFFPRDFEQHITNLVRQPEFVESFESLESGSGTKPLKIRWGHEHKNSLAVFMISYDENQRKLLMLQDITESERADQMRRDFVANVSHEIRTPLTVLSGFVETMQTLPLEEDERGRYLKLMEEQAAHMQRLVSDLLALAKLEGSPPPCMDSWVDVFNLVAAVERMTLQLSGDRRRVEFRADDGFNAQIAGDETELLSALANLVANAVRYTPPECEVEVRWSIEGDGGGVFCVEDNGPGIAKEHLPRLSERFYRVDRSRSRQTGGTGLGLSIVKHVMQRHGGVLSIESEPGKGSKFSLRFPASRVRAALRRDTDHYAA